MPARPSPLNTKGHGITMLSSRSPYSPLPSELPRTPVHGHFEALKSHEEAMKTPITPPSAYTEFLKNTVNSPAIASPKLHFPYSPVISGGPAGCRTLLHHGYYTPATPYPPPSSIPSSSRIPLPASAPLPMSGNRKSRMPPSPASAHSSPSTVSSSGSSSISSRDSSASSRRPVLEGEVESERGRARVNDRAARSTVADNGDDQNAKITKGRSRSSSSSSERSISSYSSSSSSSSDSGRVTIKQVVTTTITYTPRTMSLMPAPKGKRRRIG